MPDRLFSKINLKILAALLVLFSLTGLAVIALTAFNLRNIHEDSFTERVLLTNNLIAALINGDDIKYYADLMCEQDEAFKERQYQFQLDREELYRLQEEGAPEEVQADVISRMEKFHRDMDAYKSDRYWNTVEDLKKLKEASNSKYIYVFSDTGVTDHDGEMLYTYLFDAEDVNVHDHPDSDGLGTVGYSIDDVQEIYKTKRQMEKIFYYNQEPFGELYYAYAPILDNDGNVAALLGTDLELVKMHRDISESIKMFIKVFLTFVVIIILTIYFFLSRSVTRPLGELIGTARRIAEGDVDALVPTTALKQKSELGVLANAIAEMSRAYQSMIINRVILDSNPFACVIFDENSNIIDCNPRALEFYRYNSSDELNQNYREIIASALPDQQRDGHKAATFDEKIKKAFDDGYCEFDVCLSLYGRIIPFNIIMKLVEYKNKPAVVVYQFDLTTQKKIQRDLEHRDILLQAVSGVSEMLLTVETEHFEDILHDTFGVIGRAASVDRVYVWKNHTDDDGKLYMTQIYEWSPFEDAQQGNELTTNVLYDDAMPSWRETLLLGHVLNGAVKNLGRDQEHLLPQGIVSILIVPIFIQNKFWGFIGFDDCKNERVFLKADEDILRIFGFMVMVISDTIQNEISMNLIAAKEEALSNARTKSNFLANMSHEIRTPMNAILGMTELILHEDTTEEVLSHAADIKSACRGLLALINDILDFSKIESGKLMIESANYKTASFLVDIIGIIKMRANAKKLPFIVNLESKLPCEMIGDEVRVKQILINLLTNAIKFTHEGYISLLVSGEAVDGQIILKCSVTDTGVGIKTEDMENLFESFQQIDTRKNRNIEGTGLGLSISKQLAEMMGGCIIVESEYGVGSTFTAYIPQGVSNSLPMVTLKSNNKNSVLVYENRGVFLSSITYALSSLSIFFDVCANQSELYEMLGKNKYDYIFVSSLYANKTLALVSQKKSKAVIVALDDDDSAPLESGIISISMPIHCMQIANIINKEYVGLNSRPDDSIRTGGMIAPNAKILVVDDNIVNLKVAAGLLKTFEIKADMASSGQRAIEMVKEKAYDLVFMDHMMPEMDGIDTTVAIRRLGGEHFEKLPIIALTANAISGAREMFKAEGLDDYLAKPLEMSKLNAILSKWIPKEKQEIKTAEADIKCAANLDIPGLNTKRGIIQSGGTLENYLDILAAYTYDGENRMKDILKFYENGDIKMLTTYVHALKSASANIGAEEISQAAAGLEIAGRNGDLNFIDGNIKFFIDQFSMILAKIKPYIKINEKVNAERDRQPDFKFLREALENIEHSLENADIEATESILDELLKYDWQSNILVLIEKMKSCVSFFDYDGAENALAEIKASCYTG